jgi:hypothetical protein
MGGKRRFGDLVTRLESAQAAGMLRADRQGKQVFYSPADEHVRCTITAVVAHVGEHIDTAEAWA